jgi:hypothetical protein
VRAVDPTPGVVGLQAILLAALLPCTSCGRDGQLAIDLVFPDSKTATAAKSVVLEVRHKTGTLTCQSPTPSGAPDLKQTVTLPAPTTPIVRTAIPSGPALFSATALDSAGATIAKGCTESSDQPGEKLELKIYLY